MPRPHVFHWVAADRSCHCVAAETAASPRLSHLTPRRLRPATEYPNELPTLPEGLTGAIAPQIGQNHAQRPEDPDQLFPGPSTVMTPDITCRITPNPEILKISTKTIKNNALLASFYYYAQASRPPVMKR